MSNVRRTITEDINDIVEEQVTALGKKSKAGILDVSEIEVLKTLTEIWKLNQNRWHKSIKGGGPLGQTSEEQLVKYAKGSK